MCNHQINAFHFSKDEWNTKEDTGKSVKNTFHAQQYAKRHLSGWSDVKQWKKIKPVALGVIDLCLTEGISQKKILLNNFFFKIL